MGEELPVDKLTVRGDDKVMSTPFDAFQHAQTPPALTDPSNAFSDVTGPVANQRGQSIVNWLPMKVFDYMGCRRPIVAVTPEGTTLESIIESQQLGLVGNAENETRFEEQFRQLWTSWERGEKRWLPSNRELPREYTRPHQANQLARVLDSVTGSSSTG